MAGDSGLRKTLLLVAAGLLIGAGLGLVIIFGLGESSFDLGGLFSSDKDSPAALVPESDGEAKDFELSTLSGESLRLQELHGKAVLINFWATWCGPCREEMPLLQKYADRHSDQLIVLAVNAQESEGVVQSFVNELGLSFPVLLDSRGVVEDLYRVRAFPTSVFIDAEGTIRSQHIGVLNESQLKGYLERIGVSE